MSHLPMRRGVATGSINLVLIAAATAAGVSHAQQTEPTLEELKAQLASIQRQIAVMEKRRIAELTAAEVLVDAQRHDRLPITLLLNGDDLERRQILIPARLAIIDREITRSLGVDLGAMTLFPQAQVDFGYAVTFQENGYDNRRDKTDSGFELQDTQVGLHGQALDSKLDFQLLAEVESDKSSLKLADAFMRYAISRHLGLIGGQFEHPLSHEGNVADTFRLDSAQSLPDSILGQGGLERVQGLGVQYTDPAYRGVAIFHDGAKSANTNYSDWQYMPLPGQTPVQDPPLNTYFGVGARVEYKVAGESWLDYQIMSSRGLGEPLLVLGGGIDWTQAEDFDNVRYTLDAQYSDPGGLTIYTAVFGRNDINRHTDNADFNAYGATVQGAYAIPNCSLEPTASFSFVQTDEEIFDEEFFPEISVGANFYPFNKPYRQGGAFDPRVYARFSFLPAGAPESVTGRNVNAGENQFVVKLGTQFKF